MSKLYQLPESEKDRIRNLHLREGKDKRINSTLNEQKDAAIDSDSDEMEKMAKMSGPPMTNAGDYHMWENCAGGQVVALTHDQTATANGQSCHNAANQGIPGLVLACTQALITAFGSGPVIQWGTNQTAVKSCWKYLGTQYFNNVPNTASPNQGSNAPATTLQNCSQCVGSGGDLAWMCSDIGGGPGGTGCQQMTCPYGNQATNPAMWNTGGGCWDNQVDCNNGGLNASLNAQPCGGYQGNEHECVNGQCIPWQGGSYPTLGACQAVCGGLTHYCINCSLGQMTTYTAPGSCPTGYADLGTMPPSTPVCYECDGQGNCIGPSWNFGNNVYNSQADCQNGTPTQPACQPALTDYECANGQCIAQSGGQFTGPTALQDCQANCGQSSYDCVDWTNPNGCQAVGGTGGQFATLDDCLISPCQCEQWIINWPMYINNPNYDSAIPWNNFTDGPSNPTAIGNQLTNVQNSNAYNSTNVNQRQKARCREKALQEWLAIAAGAGACCADQNFAVGWNQGPNGGPDPDGCVAQGWINTMNNFMNNHANWPSQGCDWLNTALGNAQTQQANFQPGSGGYCKTQGKINFINNFKITGNNPYVQGGAQAVFSLPCI